MRLSDTQKRIVAIIHRDGAMTFDALVLKVGSGMRTTNVKQGINTMVAAGHLLRGVDGLFSLPGDIAALASDWAEIKLAQSKVEVAASRCNFSKGIFTGAMYANVMPRLRTDTRHISVGNSSVPFHVMDK